MCYVYASRIYIDVICAMGVYVSTYVCIYLVYANQRKKHGKR